MRIDASERAQHNRRVGYRPAHRPCGVLAVRDGHDTSAAD